MSDRCEYDPETEAAAVGVGGCRNTAAVIVGADGKWRLCASCAAQPAFSRYRSRQPIQRTPKRSAKAHEREHKRRRNHTKLVTVELSEAVVDTICDILFWSKAGADSKETTATIDRIITGIRTSFDEAPTHKGTP